MNRFTWFLVPFLIASAALGNGEIYSPNMSLPVPTVGVTTGPQYATDINTSLGIIDSHNHTPGYGVPVPPAGLNINSDLTCQSNNLTNIRAARFTSQSSPISAASPDILQLYVSGADLYYNDNASHQIRITQSGSVAGASGTITGLPSGTAGAAFSAGTFTFLQATSTAANIDAATYILRYPGSYPSPAGNYIALEAPTTLATAFSLVFPNALPVTTGSWMTSDTSGNFSWTKVDNSTLNYASNVVSVKSGGIGPTQITNKSITNAQITDGTITTALLQNDINLPGNNVTTNSKKIIASQTNAASGLGVIRGGVDNSGNLNKGEGFTPGRVSLGIYNIAFSTTFADVPAVVVTTNSSSATIASTIGASTTAVTVYIHDVTGALADDSFDIFIIGRR